MPTITSLTIYPVKGLGGIEVTHADVQTTGFAFDRHWVIVNQNNKFVSQRVIAKMALLKTSLPDEVLTGGWGAASEDAALTIIAPGMEPLQVPLVRPAGAPAQALRTVTVWAWTGQGADEGDYVAEWLTSALGRQMRLVRYIGDASAPWTNDSIATRRPSDPDFYRGVSETTFTDAYPFLMASEDSLADLNARLAEPLPMNRFRPNIVVSGGAPWEEDAWSSLVTANTGARPPINFLSVKPCSRCKVTTINQATAHVGKEPLTTLRQFRSGAALGWNALPDWRVAVFFGWNLVPEGVGRVAVGDEIRITGQRIAV